MLKQSLRTLSVVLFAPMLSCATQGPDLQCDASCELERICANLKCGAHGSCAVLDASPLCVCSIGYDGSRCDRCALGYQDEDGDGRCHPTCAVAGVVCGDHGVCETRTGLAACACEEGYVGPSCSECATGHELDADSGRCVSACGDGIIDCGPGGFCYRTAGGTPACACATGYAGPGCTECGDTYRRTEDGHCVATCATGVVDCSANKRCDDSGPTPHCECAEGYQDHDRDGSCLPTCGTERLDCGAEQVCDDQSGRPACTCIQGLLDGPLESVCFDVYVSTVSGKDGHDGTSRSRAFASLDRAAALAREIGDGVRIGLERGSRWYGEELDLQNLDSVEVGSYGSGSVPTISGAKVLSGPWENASIRGDGLKQTYSLSFSIVETAPLRWVSVLENGRRLREVEAPAAVQDRPGSYYTKLERDTPRAQIFLHPSDSVSPVMVDDLYEAASIREAITLGSGRIAGVHAEMQLSNDGSVVILRDAIVDRVLAAEGTKHNVFIGHGLVRDSVILEAQDPGYAGGSTLFVAYEPDPKASSFALERVIVGSSRGPTNAIIASTAHGVPGSAYLSFSGKQIVQLNTSSFHGVVSGGTTVMDAYSENAPIVRFPGQPTSSATLRRVLIFGQHTNSYLLPIGNSEIYDSAIFVDHPEIPQFPMLYTRPESGDLNFHHNVVVAGTRRKFMIDARSGGTTRMSRNILFNVSNTGPDLDNPVYLGDYNIYYVPGSEEVVFRVGRERITSLFEWQATCKCDGNSVFLTDKQSAHFWVGDPASGDFRIRADAVVTASDGTLWQGVFPDGRPLSEAGPSTHLEWDTRTVRSGPPKRWPNPPRTKLEGLRYVSSPKAWPW